MVIRVKGLRKSYGDLIAVDGIDFEVKKGEVFSLLGPNGAGKTTTVEILEGLRKADEGQISVLGYNPWHEGDQLHKRIGVLPQGFRFFDKSTPIEAIKYYSELFDADVDADELLRLVQLDDSANVRFEHLSGGQKQKLGLALALVSSSELLFLDEPTTGLDPQARRAIWNVIESFKANGKTVFLTTHYLDEAERLSDVVAIMNHGKIIAMGNPRQLIARYGSGRKILIEADERMYHLLKDQTGLPVTIEDGLIEVSLGKNEELSKIIQIIESSGLPYSGLSMKRDTLEDVFITLVGKMREGELN